MYVIAVPDSQPGEKARADEVAGGASAQTLINQRLRDSGGAVQLCSGTYNLDSAITMGRDMAVHGRGPSTRIKLMSGLGFTTSLISCNDPRGVSIKDLTLDGNRLSQQPNGSFEHYGLHMSFSTGWLPEMEGCIVTNIWMRHIGSAGLVMDNVQGAVVFNVNAMDVGSFGGAKAIFQLQRVERSTFGSLVGSIGNIGMRLVNSKRNAINGLVVSTIDDEGLILDGDECAYNAISSFSISDCDGPCIQLQSSPRHNVIHGGTVLRVPSPVGSHHDPNNLAASIQVDSGAYNTFSNLMVRRGVLSPKPSYGMYMPNGGNNLVHGCNFQESGWIGDIDLPNGTQNNKFRENIAFAGGWMTEN